VSIEVNHYIECRLISAHWQFHAKINWLDCPSVRMWFALGLNFIRSWK